MSRQCRFCGKYSESTKHHVIPKRHNGYKQEIMRLCKDCHEELEIALKKGTKSIPTDIPINNIEIGGKSLNLMVGSAFNDRHIQKVTAGSPVNGCDFWDKLLDLGINFFVRFIKDFKFLQKKKNGRLPRHI